MVRPWWWMVPMSLKESLEILRVSSVNTCDLFLLPAKAVLNLLMTRTNISGEWWMWVWTSCSVFLEQLLQELIWDVFALVSKRVFILQSDSGYRKYVCEFLYDVVINLQTRHCEICLRLNRNKRLESEYTNWSSPKPSGLLSPSRCTLVPVWRICTRVVQHSNTSSI